MPKNISKNNIYFGDNLKLLSLLGDNSIDSCVSDFPYNLGFMGKKWDTIKNYQEWCYERAVELYRVLKPGAYCLVFGGTRTHHRLVCAFEDAGFIIRDEIQWIYSSGFPKSYNVSKGFDKQAGVEREVIGFRSHPTLKDKSKLDRQAKHQFHGENNIKDEWEITAPNTVLAKQWDGWGTALKPAQEPVMVAQKPLDGNYCQNIEKWGVGALNIDGSRVPLNMDADASQLRTMNRNKREQDTSGQKWGMSKEKGDNPQVVRLDGRFPANIIFDEEAGLLLDKQSGITKSGKVKETKKGYEGESNTGFLRGISNSSNQHGDIGGASRFFYCAKASTKDRTENRQLLNNHPTVKPTMLIKYLIKLVTPENGTSLDICSGSGTHAKACIELSTENYVVDFIGFESDEENYKTSLERIKIIRKGLSIEQ